MGVTPRFQPEEVQSVTFQILLWIDNKGSRKRTGHWPPREKGFHWPEKG